jgi:hypothetical protein
MKTFIPRPDRRIDLLGQTFGLLTVQSFSHTKKNHSIWHCLCQCGKKTLASSNSLRLARKRSCGCLRRQIGKDSARWNGFGDIPSRHFTNIKRHAQSHKRQFDISIEYVWDLFLKQNRRCVYTGRELTFQTRADNFNGSASLDRIDSSKGYVKGNVQWVHKDVNTLKSNLSESAFLSLCAEITKHKTLDR